MPEALSAVCQVFVGGMADMCYNMLICYYKPGCPLADSSLCVPHTGTQAGTQGREGHVPDTEGHTAGGDMQMQNADLAAAESAGLFHVCSHKEIIKSAFYNFLIIL
jgi:hypothetical protein